jgi:hypothetical protein
MPPFGRRWLGALKLRAGTPFSTGEVAEFSPFGLSLTTLTAVIGEARTVTTLQQALNDLAAGAHMS